MKYKATRYENGKYKIEKVPIFQLGLIRGQEYSDTWGKLMLDNMQKRARSNYYPPIILGHGGGFVQEKEAIGFLKNIQIEGKTVYADLDEVQEYVAEYEIGKLKYPYRSVEVRFEQAEITALALLGATEPYFKFPRLEIFSEMGGGDSFTYAETEDGIRLTEEAEKSGLSKLFEDIKEWIKKEFGNAPAGGTAEGAETNETEPKGGEMDAEQFRAKYGMSPEEAAEKARQYENSQKEVERLQAEKLANAKTQFSAQMQAQGVSPAAIELMQGYMEKTGYAEEATALFGKLVELAKAGTIMVPLSESGKHAEKKLAVDLEDSDALYDAVEGYAKKNNCSFEEAEKQVLALLDKEQEG